MLMIQQYLSPRPPSPHTPLHTDAPPSTQTTGAWVLRLGRHQPSLAHRNPTPRHLLYAIFWTMARNSWARTISMLTPNCPFLLFPCFYFLFFPLLFAPSVSTSLTGDIGDDDEPPCVAMMPMADRPRLAIILGCRSCRHRSRTLN